jgi:hypothetical protein
MTTARDPLPPRLATLCERFEDWRSTRTGADRIPETLWKAAVACAARFGPCLTARVLRLDYNSLKRRIAGQGASREVASASFVEILPPGGIPASECVLEVESRQGAKLRIHLRRATVPDIALLARSFASEA